MFVAYTDMCADLCHHGHFNYLDLVYQKCLLLANGDQIQIIVGIHNDETIVSYKRTPIMSMEERCRMVSYHKRVSRIVDNAPLKVTSEYLKQFNVDALFTGTRPQEELEFMYNIPADMIHMIPYTDGISTTDLINRVLRLYGSSSSSS
jgi:ethanolamine-phosphate cytidylyltransferase